MIYDGIFLSIQNCSKNLSLFYKKSSLSIIWNWLFPDEILSLSLDALLLGGGSVPRGRIINTCLQYNPSSLSCKRTMAFPDMPAHVGLPTRGIWGKQTLKLFQDEGLLAGPTRAALAKS